MCPIAPVSVAIFTKGRGQRFTQGCSNSILETGGNGDRLRDRMIAFAVRRGSSEASASASARVRASCSCTSARQWRITLLLAQGCQLCFDPGFFLSDFFERLFGLGLAGSDGRGFSPNCPDHPASVAAALSCCCWISCRRRVRFSCSRSAARLRAAASVSSFSAASA